MVTLQRIRSIHSPAIAAMQPLYESAFPAHERRPWDKWLEVALDPDFRLYVITLDGRQAGFLTVWRFPAFSYVEHFAIDPELRGKGLGGEAIQLVVEHTGLPVILEVEPAETSADAARRIDFYRRHGFHSHDDFGYVQPPYTPGMPGLPMKLMTAAGKVDLPAAAELIKTKVYGYPPKLS